MQIYPHPALLMTMSTPKRKGGGGGREEGGREGERQEKDYGQVCFDFIA